MGVWRVSHAATPSAGSDASPKTLILRWTTFWKRLRTWVRALVSEYRPPCLNAFGLVTWWHGASYVDPALENDFRTVTYMSTLPYLKSLSALSERNSLGHRFVLARKPWCTLPYLRTQPALSERLSLGHRFVFASKKLSPRWTLLAWSPDDTARVRLILRWKMILEQSRALVRSLI